MAAAKCIVLLLLAMAVGGAHALDIEVRITNNGSDGGRRFINDIGVEYAKQTLARAARFIWKTFDQSPSERKPDVKTITLYVQNLTEIAYEYANDIYLNSDYVAKYVAGDVKSEITGLFFHEETHVWQWNGEGTAPVGLIEGVADYVRLSAGLAPPTFVKPGAGTKWDDGYDTTARFYEYLDTITPGFVGKLNAKIKYKYDVGYFKDLTGKSVDELWRDYKAKYEGTQALDIEVRITNNGSDGGTRFINDIGVEYAKQTLAKAAQFIWKTFDQSPSERKPDVKTITLYVQNLTEIAYEYANDIYLNSDYVAKYVAGDVKREITGLFYHEETHVWQWNGEGTAPVGLIEGVADYVRLSAGLAPPTWVKPGAGTRWDEGYDTTARFYAYLDTITPGFVGKLNAKIKFKYDVEYFKDLTGKSVDELWKDYKAKYGNPPEKSLPHF